MEGEEDVLQNCGWVKNTSTDIYIYIYFLEGLAQWYDACILVLLYNELMSTRMVSCLHFGCI